MPRKLLKSSQKISESFPLYDGDMWYGYNNPIENKKTCQEWYRFPPEIYQTLQDLCSNDFIESPYKICPKFLYSPFNRYPAFGFMSVP